MAEMGDQGSVPVKDGDPLAGLLAGTDGERHVGRVPEFVLEVEDYTEAIAWAADIVSHGQR